MDANDASLDALEWLAVPSDRPEAVLEALQVTDARPSSAREVLGRGLWSTGSTLFVTRPVDGWTLVFGRGVAAERHAEDLSQAFGEAQAFRSDPAGRTFTWARLVGGRVARVAGNVRGTPLVDGERTPSEPRSLRAVGPDEVRAVAGAWSVDPRALMYQVPVGGGWLASRDRRARRGLALLDRLRGWTRSASGRRPS